MRSISSRHMVAAEGIEALAATFGGASRVSARARHAEMRIPAATNTNTAIVHAVTLDLDGYDLLDNHVADELQPEPGSHQFVTGGVVQEKPGVPGIGDEHQDTHRHRDCR